MPRTKSRLRKGTIALAAALPLVIVIVLLRLFDHAGPGTPTTLTITGRTNENGRQVVVFELQVASDKRIGIRRANLVTDWGACVEMHGPPEWMEGKDPSKQVFRPGTKKTYSIIEPSERLRRLRLETMEYETGPRALRRKLGLLWQTKNLSVLTMDLPSEHRRDTYVQSGLISSYASEPDGVTKQGQLAPPQAGQAPAAPGSGR